MAQSRTSSASGTIRTYFLGIVALVCIIAAAADFFPVAHSASPNFVFWRLVAVAGVQAQVFMGNARDALAGQRGAFGALETGGKKVSHAISIMGNGDPPRLRPAAKGRVA